MFSEEQAIFLPPIEINLFVHHVILFVKLKGP